MPITKINVENRAILFPLFDHCPYDRVLTDSVLEGNFGRAYADSASNPTAARLDSGAFTIVGGNPQADGVMDLLSLAPIEYVTPQNDAWRQVLEREYERRITALTFIDFSPVSLDLAHLEMLSKDLPPGYELRRINQTLADRLNQDMGSEYFLENYHSVNDFLKRGVGFCILFRDKLVSAATAMAQFSTAIDIEIVTLPDFRRRGLGTSVGAALVAYCLEQRIDPRWLAANEFSEKLALKLGYVNGEIYTTFAISNSN